MAECEHQWRGGDELEKTGSSWASNVVSPYVANGGSPYVQKDDADPWHPKAATCGAYTTGPAYDRKGSQARSSGGNAYYGRDRLNPEDYKLYVAGLPHYVNEKLMRSIFGQYGRVVNTQVLQRPSNDTTLAGYVTMEDPKMAIWLVENLNGNIAPGVAFVLSIRYAVAPQKLDIDPSKMVAGSREAKLSSDVNNSRYVPYTLSRDSNVDSGCSGIRPAVSSTDATAVASSDLTLISKPNDYAPSDSNVGIDPAAGHAMGASSTTIVAKNSPSGFVPLPPLTPEDRAAANDCTKMLMQGGQQFSAVKLAGKAEDIARKRGWL